MKKILIVLCIFACFFPMTILAKSYNITNLYLEAEIDEENIYHITEYYNVYFEENTFFRRAIPLQLDVYTSNKNQVRYITTVNHFKTENSYTEEITSKFHEIKFEKEEKDTNTTYLFTYDYHMGNDKDKKADIIYLPLVDYTNGTKLTQMSFSISVKNIETLNHIKFYMDGNDITEQVDYQISNNVITGTINQDKFQGKSISVQIILNQGYFKNTEATISYTQLLYIVFPIGVFILSFLMYKKYKYKNKIEVDIQNFDSLEMAYLYRGKVHMLDIISIIFHLANDGYLTVKNYGSGENVQYKLIKVKEYDKENAGEKIVFDGLFQNKEEVDAESINGIFSSYLEDVRQVIENKKNYRKLFYPKVKKYKKILAVLFFFSIIISNIQMFYFLFGTYVIAISVSVILGILLFIMILQANRKIYNIMYIVMLLLVCLGVYALWHFTVPFIVYIISYILLTGTIYLYSQTRERTEYGNAVLQEIESFKDSLMVVNPSVIEVKLKEDPNYIYKMLPYTIIFELTGWWLQSNEKYTKANPFWYSSSEPYTSEKLAYCIEKIIETLAVCMQTNKKLTDELLNQAPNKLL